MAPDDARIADASIACLFVVRLEFPYLFTFTQRYVPTRDFAYDVTGNGTAMVGRLEHFVVFNRRTGSQYAKHSLTN